jgi:hypothetical protein
VKNGTRVKLRETWKGSARKRTKTIEELSRNVASARANASAADKGKMTLDGRVARLVKENGSQPGKVAQSAG